MAILRLKPLSAAIAALSVGACVSILPEVEAPKALLEIPAPAATSAFDLSSDVSVFAPESSRAVSGVDIAVAEDGALQYLQGVKWADASPRLLQGALIDALTAGGGEGYAFSAQSATRADFEVRWRVTTLSVSPGSGPARAEARVSVLDARSRRVIAETTVRASGDPTSARAEDRANALVDAVMSLTEDAAKFIAEHASLAGDGAS